ncbi:MAG: PEP-CTERM sorting domain-containing protein [Rhodospirillaceae bacterium]|nr:PEP-CTERM sorting domain-containing protein [Rhodospirillaceae bacterium]
MRYFRTLAAAGILLVAPLTAQAVPFTYELEFQTTGQSLWDTGTETTLDKTAFLGAAWQDKSAKLDLIAGNEDTNVPNPLRVAYDTAFGACRGLGFSASVCINGQSARVPVPALGSRPSVRSCGKFAVACKIAQGADIVKRTAYDVAFAACKKLGNSSSTCRNGRSGRLPVLALGTAPPQFLEVDTRTGVAVEGTSDGRVGLEFGIEIGSGSVDATVSYAATLDIPDTSILDKANAISFNPNSVLAGTNVLTTDFADLSLSADAVFELSGSVTGEACIVPTGCVTGSTPFDIDATAPILSFNEDGEGGILLLGQKPSVFGFPDEANGFPFTIDAGVSGLATATLHLPQPDASGGLDTATGTLKASAQDDLVDLNVDVDAAVSLAVTGGITTNAFGFEVPIGNVGSVGLQIGPSIDLRQDFELDPTLFVQLVFDKAVMVAGELVTELISAWDLLPDILFLDDVTTVTPTFFVDAELQNNTLLDFDLDFLVDLLQINFDLLGFDRQFGIGNVLEQSVDLFQSPDLFSNLFSLQGFDLQLGESFVVDFLAGSTAPDDVAARSAVNPIEKIDLASVPEPGAIAIFLTGLGGLVMIRRRTTISS